MRYCILFLSALYAFTVNGQVKGAPHKKNIESNGYAYGLEKGTMISVVPAAVKAKFVSTYPGTDVTWSKKSSYYTASYVEGNNHIFTTYSSTGSVVETIIEIPIADAPEPVVLYKNHNPSLEITGIIQLLQPNKDPLYRLKTSTGNFIYIAEDGMKIKW